VVSELGAEDELLVGDLGLGRLGPLDHQLAMLQWMRW
jgi:hypothetical protein